MNGSKETPVEPRSDGEIPEEIRAAGLRRLRTGSPAASFIRAHAGGLVITGINLIMLGLGALLLYLMWGGGDRCPRCAARLTIVSAIPVDPRRGITTEQPGSAIIIEVCPNKHITYAFNR